MLAAHTGRMKRSTCVVAFGVVALVAGAASAPRAADLPAPPATYLPLAPPYNWSGFYVGGNIGLGWARGDFSDPIGNTLSLPNNTQFLGGGQVGINYEFDSGFVIGAEGDFNGLANSGNATTGVALVNPAGVPTGSTAAVTMNNRWLTTATGRLGYAWDRVLVYAKGGDAWVGTNNPTVTISGAPVAVTNTSNNWGWVAGFGGEWAFWGTWSARVEFDYVGLNTQTFTLPGAAGGLPAGDQFNGNNRFIQVVNAGVNYKFGAW